jgi:hypothetical protein
LSLCCSISTAILAPLAQTRFAPHTRAREYVESGAIPLAQQGLMYACAMGEQFSWELLATLLQSIELQDGIPLAAV